MLKTISIKKALPILVSCLILFLIFRDISLDQVFASIQNASLFWLTIYFALAAFEPVIRGGRWHFLLGLGTKDRAIKGLYIAKAGNNILPLRFGDVIRSQYVKDKDNIPYSISLPSILSEIFLDLSALAIIAVVYSLINPSFSSLGYFLLSGLIAVTAIFVVIYRMDLANKYTGANKLILILQRMIIGILSSFSSKSIIPIIAYTVFLWCYTLFMTFAGLRMILPEVSLPGVLATIVFAYLTATIPSAPGFIGTYHAAIAAGILVMGYSLSDYPAVPILVHLVQYIPQTAIGIIIGSNYLFNNNWSKVRQTLMGREKSIKERV